MLSIAPMEKKITLEQFLDRVGRQRFQDEIGKSTQLVTRAKEDGMMPAHWFLDVRNWCVRNQLDVPEHLFRWSVKSRGKQNANDAAEFQVGGKESLTPGSAA